MKLIIQVPCWNEEGTLPSTLAALPREVEGFDSVEILVIDDGSSDNTIDAALEHGAHYVLPLSGHQGLARAFSSGLEVAIRLGADVIVNTDADNQYDAGGIPKLVKPILGGAADVVVGARPIQHVLHFSWFKRTLQRFGSWVMKTITQANIQDAPSGFRAFSREAALRVQVFDDFTYTLETLIQAASSRLRILSVPVSVNAPTRPSRLFRSNLAYVYSSILTIAKTSLIYRSTLIFGSSCLLSFMLSLFFGLRYGGILIGEGAKGHPPSLHACSIFAFAGLLFTGCGLVAYLLGINRRVLEELRYRARCVELPHLLQKSNSLIDELGECPQMKEAHQGMPERPTTARVQVLARSHQ